MKTIEGVEMLASLMAKRAAALRHDDAWENYTDADSDHAFNKLNVIQNNILDFDFRDPAAKLLALSLLIDDVDQPNFADHFKNELFARLRACKAED